MFAPARLWTSVIPARSSTDATIAAVVVLPLVAEITTEPSRSRAASSPIASGSSASSTLPGQARAAAAPARRASAPTARAATSFAPAALIAAPDDHPHGCGQQRGRSPAARRSGRRRRTA